MNVNIKIYGESKSKEIRNKFTNIFINKESPYYLNLIEKMEMYCDGLCYDGYLWDCLENFKVISEKDANEMIKEKERIFVMWDIHSCQKIFIPDYWKFPKESVLCIEKWDEAIKKELPEDIYLFDESFQWSVIFTHEDDSDGERYCLLARK
ncbi:MAG: hypothetical protein J6A50_03665 [Clostridia bacterium]|nr:hypothetical protein [Clostridia bacterium]